MQTFNQYLPRIEEKKGKFYMPLRAWVGGLVALLLLTVLLGYAFNYPSSKKQDAIELINQFNQKTEDTKKKTGEVISRMATLAPSLQSEYSRANADKDIQKLREQVNALTAVNPTDIVTNGFESLKKWDEAQTVIQSSPYRDFKVDDVPKTDDGLKFLQAKKAKKPEGRFDYQFLMTDGKTEAIKRYKDSMALLINAQRKLFDLDRSLNGDKAAPLGHEAQQEDNFKANSGKEGKKETEQKLFDGLTAQQGQNNPPAQVQANPLEPVVVEQSVANTPMPTMQQPEPVAPVQTNKTINPMSDKVKLAGWIHNHAGTPHFSPSWDCSSEIPDLMPACEAQAHNLTPAQLKKMGIVLP